MSGSSQTRNTSGPPTVPFSDENLRRNNTPGLAQLTEDLARHGYFTRGEGICGILEEHGFSYIHPVMMDHYDTYLIRGKKEAENQPTYFVWNPISGTVLVVRRRNLTEIVEIMGRSVLALDMVDLEDIADSGSPTGVVMPKLPRTGRGVLTGGVGSDGGGDGDGRGV